MAIEEPAFDRIEQSEPFEVRQYRSMIVAETFVDAELDQASNIGFRRIADYIFGNNRSRSGSTENEKIAMTAPVTAAPAEKIAMTAPVTMEPQQPDANINAKRWRIHFVMPAQYQLSTLPQPVNNDVLLREIPAKRYAVLVFSGFAGQQKVQEKTEELLSWMRSKKLQAIGAPQLARYNPPWTLPFFRRNEILIEISHP